VPEYHNPQVFATRWIVKVIYGLCNGVCIFCKYITLKKCAFLLCHYLSITPWHIN